MNILIVDDRPPNLRLLRFILESEGHTASEATDGVEALVVLNREPVDVIISDILMPRMDGYRLCQEVRKSERLRGIPFIFYTATYTSPGDEKLCLEMGGDKYMKKPATPEAILAAVEEVSQNGARRVCRESKPGDEEEVMKEYNARLVFKLEEKLAELLLQTTAMENAANAITITDSRGHILRVNPAFTTLSGYAAEEVIGQTPRVLKSGQHDQAFFRELWRTILTGETWRGEFINRRKDGSLYHGEQTITPVRAQGGPITHFIGIMNDVTERKRAEEALHESERMMRLVMDLVPHHIFAKDAEGRHLFANRACAAANGLTPEQMVGLTNLELAAGRPEAEAFMRDDRQVISSGLPKVVQGEPSTDRTGQIRYFQTTKMPFIAPGTGEPAVLGVAVDITERKRAEEEVRRTADLLRAVSDGTTDAVFVKDLAGRYLFCNEAAARFVGRPVAEVIGRDDTALFEPESAQRVMANDRAVRESGLTQTTEEHLTAAGVARLYLATKAPYRDAQENIIGTIGISHDITERKKLEEQLLRAQRLESIGTLAGGIAHDLNNVLGPIVMSLDLLAMKFTDPSSAQMLDVIRTSAQRGTDMVRQVLSFARGVEGRRMELQVAHLVRDIEKIANDTFLKHIQIRIRLPRDLWTVIGDPTQLHQVLLNLCVNARDAMPNGGTLSLTAENLQLDAQYAGSNPEAHPGSYVVLQVKDTGTGIPPEIAEKIFDPFFTTKEIGKGTGLGLSTTLAIVKSHRGFIRVHSELGSGTTFEVYLPAQTEASADAKAESTLEIPHGHGELILVVDDEASVRLITQQTLETFGYRVVLAADGAEALAVYSTRSTEIAVVLTDMMMPVMDGATTIQVLHKINPEVRIIAASGLTANSDVTSAPHLGIKHFLPKPFTAETLLKVLKELLTTT
jgi:PAS domain S-box-containing protein